MSATGERPLVEARPENRSSNRGFGLFFAAVALVVGAWPLLSGGRPGYAWWMAGGLLTVLALFAPAMLGPLNRAWFEFGLLLHRLLNPLILGLVYVTSVVPVGLAMRLLGKDPLNRAFDPGLDSYWVRREPPGPGPDSLPRQF